MYVFPERSSAETPNPRRGHYSPDFLSKLNHSSRFQAIVGLAQRRIVGHEALLSSVHADGRQVRPELLFNALTAHTDDLTFEQAILSRHLESYSRYPRIRDEWLFLNVSSPFLINHKEGAALIAQHAATQGIQPHQIVIEILESEIQDLSVLIEALNSYRAIGCLIAVDDFGSGHSNLDRVCDINPNIVKLDRRLIQRAGSSDRGIHLLTRITQMLHEVGSMVLAEGIETEVEAITVLDAHIDMAQGYYFARPDAAPFDYPSIESRIDDMWRRYYDYHKEKGRKTAEVISRYTSTISFCAGRLACGLAFSPEVLSIFSQLPGLMRLYLLDANGQQIGQNLCLPECLNGGDIRYRPMQDLPSAIWHRRDYFRMAIAHPGEVQVTEPYLSICGNRSCVTLSIGFLNRGALQVLCADIEWDSVREFLSRQPDAMPHPN